MKGRSKISNSILFRTMMAVLIFGSTEARDAIRPKRLSPTFFSRPAEQHECSKDSDCSSIPNTSCAQDSDKKYRCLCADSSQPVGGACRKLPKKLRTYCEQDYECLPGAECVQESEDSKFKMCFCQDYYTEVNNTCVNGGVQTIAGSLAIVAGVTYTIYVGYYFHQ